MERLDEFYIRAKSNLKSILLLHLFKAFFDDDGLIVVIFDLLLNVGMIKFQEISRKPFDLVNLDLVNQLPYFREGFEVIQYLDQLKMFRLVLLQKNLPFIELLSDFNRVLHFLFQKLSVVVVLFHLVIVRKRFDDFKLVLKLNDDLRKLLLLSFQLFSELQS